MTARRWPLVLIALPAATSIWSGWVGLGGMAGFGVVHPLPGIWDQLELNTAVTLPIGVEAYGAYALGAWLTPTTPEAARRFAKRSAIGALALGMTGQVLYHLLAAAGAHRAPWPVVILVSCLPVAVLGFAAALTHLLRAPDQVGESGAPGTTPEPVVTVPEPVTTPGPVLVRPAPAAPGRDHSQNRSKTAETEFGTELAAGTVPSLRQVKARMHVGHDRARTIRDHLQQLVITGERAA